jgi:cbb3-type cytochrome oxidase maturation protein
MEVMVILLPLALLLALFFIGAFIWSARKGQFDDMETPRFRMLLDDEKILKKSPTLIKDGK